jgi:hypothetical protein
MALFGRMLHPSEAIRYTFGPRRNDCTPVAFERISAFIAQILEINGLLPNYREFSGFAAILVRTLL